MTTQKDVAEYANVSFITVSRVINNKGNVKPETKKRVLEAIKELNYYPNTFAQGLNVNKVNTIAVLPYLRQEAMMEETSYHRRIITGIEHCCSEYGYDILLSTQHGLEEEVDFLRPYYQRKADGLILIGVDSESKRFNLITEDNIPCSILGEQKLETMANLLNSDNFHGGRLITEYLIRQGHTKIAYLTVENGTSNTIDRFESFRTVMASHDLIIPEEYIIKGNFLEESGHMAIRKIASLPDPPTALITANDELLLGALAETKIVGLRVPEDLSLVGFDGHEFTNFTTPPLATVIQDLEGMGYRATELVINQINNKEVPGERQIFPVIFEPRESIKLINSKSMQ